MNIEFNQEHDLKGLPYQCTSLLIPVNQEQDLKGLQYHHLPWSLLH